VGVSPTLFDRAIRDHLMPQPVRIFGRTVWRRQKLDEALAALDKTDDGDDPWGRMVA
jgi:hypothetical protein